MLKKKGKLIVYIMVFVLSGCGLANRNLSNIFYVSEPAKLPDSIKTPDLKIYNDGTYREAYDKAMGFIDYSTGRAVKRQMNNSASANLTTAKRERDKIINQMLTVIDSYYSDFITQLWTSHALQTTVTDFITLGLNAAGAVTSAQLVQSVLAATSAGVVGANASIDKNILANGTIQAIVLQMDTNRNKVLSIIKLNENLDVDKYNLEAAVNDLINYYKAGTLIAGIINLTTSVSSAKTESDLTFKQALITIEALKNPPPTSVKAIAGDKSATVTFAETVVNGIVPNMYVVTSDPDKSTAYGQCSPIIVPNLKNGTSYTFTVIAINSTGTSPPSSPSQPIIPSSKPGAPTVVEVVPGNTSATVAFSAPADNGSAIIGYKVASNPAGGIDSNAGATALTHTITGLTNGRAYTFTVTATNGVGDGPASLPSSSVTPAVPPGAPTVVNVTPTNARAVVVFTAPANDGGSAITGYKVASDPAGGIDSNAGTTILTHIVTGLTNGQAYTFTVTATNGVGNGPASSPSSFVMPAAPPGAPTVSNVIPGNANATVTFIAPASDGGSAITGYKVASNPAGGIDSNAGTTALTHTITGLTNGQAYTFTVTATNGAGDGPASSPSPPIIPQ